jgi:hypothetical protein
MIDTKLRHYDITKLRDLILTIVLALGLIGCKSATGPGPSAGGDGILFIGNSLTYTNNLPRTLADMAKSAGATISVASVALPNYALIDHVKGGSDAFARIAEGGWKFVVVQQGPTSSVGLDRDTLDIAVRAIDAKARLVGARTAVYMVWPSLDRIGFFGTELDSYHGAALAIDGVFLPAGEAWREAWKVDASLDLYGPDNFHPSPLGTYLAALVIFECVTGKDARDLGAQAVVSGAVLSASSTTVRMLQRVAHETNLRFGCR